MNISRKIIVGIFLAFSFLTISIPANARVSVNIGIPLFYDEPNYSYYHDRPYRIYNHHYYHYDINNRRWHYGRTHREGLREEERRQRHGNRSRIKWNR